MEKVASSIAALGVPGLVLLVAMSATGYAGAAALTTALAALGPGGMVGGIALLGAIGLASKAIAEYGFDAVFIAVVKELEARGETASSILRRVESYPISRELKLKVREELRSSV